MITRNRRGLVACFAALLLQVTSGADEIDFHASLWTQIEDGVPFEYMVLKKGNSRILIPKLEGYSLDSSGEKLTMYRAGVEITLRAADENCVTAVRQGNTAFLRDVSRPASNEGSETRLASESQSEFAMRNWRSFSFQYSHASFGRPSELWVSYLSAFDQNLILRVNAAPDAFQDAKRGILAAIIRSRAMDSGAFERQAERK